MPIYQYKHPDTEEIFEEIRKIKDRDKPFIAEDGVKCPRLEIPLDIGYCGRSEKDREVFEIDSEYTKKCNPKYVKFRDGHREKYDPSKHC
jgi:hypothetical protein